MYNTRENIRCNIHEGLKLISDMVGNGYRPQSIVAGFMDAENQRLLASDEGIHVCQGQIWSQHAIDNGDGDGGICYPYYPSREHYLKPARWSLQKGTRPQDKPIPLSQLAPEDQQPIFRRYPNLRTTA